jgi:hypothetical protein
MSHFANSCGIALSFLAFTACNSSDFSGATVNQKPIVSKKVPPAASNSTTKTESPASENDSHHDAPGAIEAGVQGGAGAGSTGAAEPSTAPSPTAPSPTAAAEPSAASVPAEIPVAVTANILHSASNSGSRNCVSISANGGEFLELQCLQGEGVKGPPESRTLMLRKASLNAFALQNNNHGGNFCATLLEGGARLIIGLEDYTDNDYNDYMIDVRATEGARFENPSYPSCENWGIDENSFTPSLFFAPQNRFR